MNTYQIATIPGDGIGKEVIPESVKILNAIAAKCGFQLKFKKGNLSSNQTPSNQKTGRLLRARAKKTTCFLI